MPEIDNEIPELIDPSITNKDVTLITIEKLIEDAGNDGMAQADAVEAICLLLANLRNPFKASYLTTELVKSHKGISKTMVSNRVKELIKTLPKEKVEEEITDCETEDIPDDVNIRDIYKTGFYIHKGRYYFLTKDGNSKGIKVSNFIINPLFHIYSKTDNKRLVEIRNEYGTVKILDIQSKNMTSSELFFQSVYGEGNFVWNGSKYQWLKILEYISREFPLCNELKTLGWQKEGFYAFANGVFSKNKWQPVDQYGITEHKGVKYFSPAFSTVYAGTRQDDDEYENDRAFIYKQASITLKEWCSLMIEVYGENAVIAIAYAFTSLFRDLIYEKHKCFPLLFMFGEKQSGKSQLAWSISNLFFDNLPAFNLNSGTQVGFHRRLARFRNTVAFFDEFTNDIPEPRFQGLKSSFDGIGHEKGKMSKDNRTEITKVNAACMPIGQYLPTRDDNALNTRAILLTFEKKRYSKEQTEKFERLKEYELQGLSSLLCDLLIFREDIEKRVIREYSEIMDKIKDDMVNCKQAFDERLIRNYCSILSVLKIITSKIDIGFSYSRAYDIAMERLPEQTMQISSSESLANFWSMVEYLLDNKMIEAGKDFVIKGSLGENLVNSRNVKENVMFKTAKEILFIRFSKIHPLYMEAHRKQFGKNGVDLVSLMHYIKHHHSYLGYKDSYRFDHSVSSCYCFDYVALNANLSRLNIDDPDPKNTEIKPVVESKPVESYDPVKAYNDKKAEQLPF
jgi:hypothetical protein